MDKSTATATVKAINRHVNKAQVFSGGRMFGVDYTTWAVCYPQTAKMFNDAASIMLGREVTRAVPIFR